MFVQGGERREDGLGNRGCHEHPPRHGVVGHSVVPKNAERQKLAYDGLIGLRVDHRENGDTCQPGSIFIISVNNRSHNIREERPGAEKAHAHAPINGHANDVTTCHPKGYLDQAATQEENDDGSKLLQSADPHIDKVSKLHALNASQNAGKQRARKRREGRNSKHSEHQGGSGRIESIQVDPLGDQPRRRRVEHRCRKEVESPVKERSGLKQVPNVAGVFFVKGCDLPDGGFIDSERQQRGEQGIERQGKVDNSECVLAQLLEDELHRHKIQDDEQSLPEQIVKNVFRYPGHPFTFGVRTSPASRSRLAGSVPDRARIQGGRREIRGPQPWGYRPSIPAFRLEHHRGLP